MAFKDNWPLHLTAALTGDGASDQLAQDFWSEELFNYKSMVRFHLLKLVWVYLLCSLTQVALPGLIFLIPVTFYQNGGSDWTWTLIAISFGAVGNWLFLVLVAIAIWADLKRKARKDLEAQ
ncbi:hypothetical protein [Achromobacter ruhlandii]|uniref:hypothetical protein n=1 Tax=Achromobacter ruhlandii TaxID=72557 RepID=UPI0028A9DA0E|nr:hypothetical protein [Achromobacter ruhlandii]